MNFDTKTEKLPVAFIGHGSPMNAIEDNEFSRAWKILPDLIPTPKAILCISAHWTTSGTAVTAMDNPKTIHDFGGFPQELFQVQYPAKGSLELAELIKANVKKTDIILDKKEWGLDHGTWSILKLMYPEANIPVVQLSLDYYKPASYHYELAKELAFLREQGVFIMASGNVVHNLRYADFTGLEPYDWAVQFDQEVKDLIIKGEHKSLIEYEKMGKHAMLSIPTPEHYYPLLYILGLQDPSDEVIFPVEGMSFRSGSMLSVMFK